MQIAMINLPNKYPFDELSFYFNSSRLVCSTFRFTVLCMPLNTITISNYQSFTPPSIVLLRLRRENGAGDSG